MFQRYLYVDTYESDSEIYLHIRHETGCFEKWSFLKAGLYWIPAREVLPVKAIKMHVFLCFLETRKHFSQGGCFV